MRYFLGREGMGVDWSPDDLRDLSAFFAPSKTQKWAQRSFPNSPHGVTENGLRDFRRLPIFVVQRFDISDCDFSGARGMPNEHGVTLGINMNTCRCKNVLFTRASRFYQINGLFNDCDFDRITTDRASIHGRFTNCTFKGANLRRSSLSGDFENCVFDGADLRLNSWGGSSFRSCSFVNTKIELVLKSATIFSEIQELANSAPSVTFSVLVTGGIKAGQTVTFFNPRGLDSQPWAG